MSSFTFFLLTTIFYTVCCGLNIYVSDVNFRIEPGEKMCVYETGKAGQMLEAYYQVLDGQHGDLDISFEVIDPKAVTLVSYFKSSENSIIMDLKEDGDYAFCLDNTHSLLNSKLVFLYILIEDKNTANDVDAEVAVVDDNGAEKKEVLEWAEFEESGQIYHIEVGRIADSLTLTLGQVVKARHLLDIYGATKSRDSYVAFEDTFIVDAWSGFQIFLMFVVGMLQVYMIKKLFTGADRGYKNIY